MIITRTLVVHDNDMNENMIEAKVSFSSNYVAGDMLAYTPITGIPITSSFEPVAGVLTMTGTTTTANYQTALRTVTFKATPTYNFRDVPSNHNKVVKFVIKDANNAYSAPAIRAINITAPMRVLTEVVEGVIKYDEK